LAGYVGVPLADGPLEHPGRSASSPHDNPDIRHLERRIEMSTPPPPADEPGGSAPSPSPAGGGPNEPPPPGKPAEKPGQKEIEKFKSDKEHPEKVKLEKEHPEKVKLEKDHKEIKDKPEKEKGEKETKLEIKETKFEHKEAKEKEAKVEIKETKLEHKEVKEGKPEKEKHDGKEFKAEAKIEIKEHKVEVKEFEKPVVEKGDKEIAESGPGQGGGDPALGLDPGALLAHADNLVQAGQQLRHFIETSMRPDLSGGALNNEDDLQSEPGAGG
jgi:6-pyruvoyl-tetrahydropterin synthase